MKKFIIIISIVLGSLCILGVSAYFIVKSFINQSSPTLSITYPSKTSYYVGEASDFSDLKVEIFDKKYIEIDDYTIEGFDSSKVCVNQKITITVDYKNQLYYGYFYVNINEIPKPNVSLVKIELSSLPNKIEYHIGEVFNPEGGILKLIYSDQSTKKINLLREYVSGFDSSKVNENLVLTITYQENGMVYTTTLNIKVVD